MAAAYYNENDPFAVAWLRELIKAGHIAPGDVDDRSMIDVSPDDLIGYDQCHFFAGIGTWSYALRLAGWPDGKPVWTGSPPCQPFSVAGKQKGVNDERHLAPQWLALISELRPPIVFGEQVESAIRHGWLDDLQTHLEEEDYACGAIVLPACSVGAPHIRQRLWFVAERLGITRQPGLEGYSRHGNGVNKQGRHETQQGGSVASAGGDGWMAHGASERRNRGKDSAGTRWWDGVEISGGANRYEPASTFVTGWDDPDWLFCRDGKWRPVESGTSPLVGRATNHVGRLRGYGNGIVAPLAQAFIEAYLFSRISFNNKPGQTTEPGTTKAHGPGVER